MKKHYISIAIVMLVSAASFALGHSVADPVEIKTVEKEKIVNPAFDFKVGDKKYCEISTEIKPCEIIAQKSSGSYAIKYHEDGWAGGDKIIIMDADNILR